MDVLIARLGLDPALLIAGNPLVDWLYALAIGVGTFVVLLLLRRLLVGRVTGFSAKGRPQTLRLIATLIAKTRVGPLLAVSLVVGSKYLELSSRAERFTTGAIVLLVAVQVGVWLTATATFYLEENRAQSGDPIVATSVNILDFCARLVIWTIVLLVALSNFGVNITAALTGLGIGGVAVALAVQSVLGDLLASISIALDKPFVVGDVLTVDTLTGAVESVGVRSTRLRSTSGEQIVIANADILKSRVRNYSRLYERRKVFTFKVAYDTPVDKLAEIPGLVRDIVGRQPKARFERCHLRNLGEAALEFEVSLVSEDREFASLLSLEQAVNLELLSTLAAHQVEIPVASTVAVPATGPR